MSPRVSFAITNSTIFMLQGLHRLYTDITFVASETLRADTVAALSFPVFFLQAEFKAVPPWPITSPQSLAQNKTRYAPPALDRGIMLF